MKKSDWLSLYYNYTRLAGRAQGGMAVSEYDAGVYFWKI